MGYLSFAITFIWAILALELGLTYSLVLFFIGFGNLALDILEDKVLDWENKLTAKVWERAEKYFS